MKCPECGNEVGPEERFCGNCGAPIEREVAASEGAEPTPSDQTMVPEAAGLLEEEAELPAQEPPSKDHDFAPALPPPPSAEEAAAPPEEETVPPPEEEEVVPSPAEESPPPAATSEPPPPPPTPTPRGQDSKKLWIIVAIVVVVLASCCCALVVGALLLAQIDSMSMILPHAPSLPL